MKNLAQSFIILIIIIFLSFLMISDLLARAVVRHPAAPMNPRGINDPRGPIDPRARVIRKNHRDDVRDNRSNRCERRDEIRDDIRCR